MNIFLKRAASAAALVVACAQAFAAGPIGQTDTYDFGSLTMSKGISVGDPYLGFIGTFDNYFSFTVPIFRDVEALFSSIDSVGDMTAAYRVGFGSAGNQTWLSLMPPAVPVPQSSAGDFNISSKFSGFSPGITYWVEISGSATQAAYSFDLTPTLPVPEAESWVMLLAGLGALGALGATTRRRSALKLGNAV